MAGKVAVLIAELDIDVELDVDVKLDVGFAA